MPSIEELLDQAENETSAIEPVNDILEIDPETRTVLIPDSEIIFGVEADQRAERKYFRCPKIVGNNIDLSELEIYVIFQNAGGSDEENRDAYHVQDLEDTGDGYVTFSWELTEKVTRYVGQVSFVVAATRTLSDGTLQNRWSTTIATGKSLIGLQTGMSENEQQQASDLYTQLITELNAKAEIKKSEITTLTNEKKSLLENTGTNQKNLVESEGTKQIQAVENKGTATLATIPEDYTALNTSVNDLNDLMHMKAPAIVEEATSGKEITVNDSADGMRLQELNVYGKSWQVTTTGKNLINADEYYLRFKQSDGTYKAKTVILNDIRISLSEFVGKQVTLSVKVTVATGVSSVYIVAYIGSEQKRINGSTITSGLTGKSILTVAPVSNTDYFTISYGSGNGDVTFSELQLELGSVATSYEPYTGGKPSPSPEYPQEIESVGRVLSTGKNLFDFSKLDANYGLNVKDKTIVIPAKTNNVGYYNSLKELCPNIKAGNTYVLNAKTSNPEALRVVHLVNTDIDFNFGKAFVPTEEQINDKIAFYNNSDIEKENVISEIQLEEGNIATSYEPYTGGVPALYQKDVEVKLTGKNLFGGKAFADKIVEIGGSLDETNKTVTINASLIDSKIIYEFPDKTKQYTVMLQGYNGYEIQTSNIKVIYEDGLSDALMFANGKVLFATNQNKKPTKLVGTYYSGASVFIYEQCGIFEGVLTETDFKPYKYQSFPITTPTGLPAIPVPSSTSGITYTDSDGQAWIADEIDFARGKYIQRVWQVEFDGSEDEVWARYSIRNGWVCNDVLPENMKARNGFCNEKKVGVVDRDEIQLGSKSTDDNKIFYPNSNYYDTSLSDYGLSNWKAHLAEKPLKVMTYLDNPIETDLSEEQIQAYKAIHTNKPTTIISNNADAWMGASYAADTKIWIENKIKEIVTS